MDGPIGSSTWILSDDVELSLLPRGLFSSLVLLRRSKGSFSSDALRNSSFSCSSLFLIAKKQIPPLVNEHYKSRKHVLTTLDASKSVVMHKFLPPDTLRLFVESFRLLSLDGQKLTSLSSRKKQIISIQIQPECYKN